jgi:microcystin-dependent protein
MPDHTHSPQTVDVRGAAEQGILGGKIPIAGTNGATSTTPVATTAAGGGPTSAAGTGATGSAGSGTAHQNMQPYVGVNKLIRVL